MGMLHFAYLLLVWLQAPGLFPAFGYYEYAEMNIHVK
jgi:hypothetical protein